jgi:hypothetical protein
MQINTFTRVSFILMIRYNSILHSRTGGDETKGKTQEKMERRGRKESSGARSEETERAGDR